MFVDTHLRIMCTLHIFVLSIKRNKLNDMTTQKVIIEVIKTGAMVAKNPSDNFLIEKEFNSLNNSKNYAWMFQATQQYWTPQQWRIVAADVQAQIRNYKGK